MSKVNKNMIICEACGHENALTGEEIFELVRLSDADFSEKMKSQAREEVRYEFEKRELVKMAEFKKKEEYFQKKEADLKKKEATLRDEIISKELPRMEDEIRKELAQKNHASFQTKLEKIQLDNNKLLDQQTKQHQEVMRKMLQKIKEVEAKAEANRQANGLLHQRNICDEIKEFFPKDTLTEAKVGEEGPDIIHEFNDENYSGTLIWEIKDTTGPFQSRWIEKVLHEKEIYEADSAVIVTNKLPANFQNPGFGVRDGVVIVHPDFIYPVAYLLRYAHLKLKQARSKNADSDLKTDALYKLIFSDDFDNALNNLTLDHSKHIQLLENGWNDVIKTAQKHYRITVKSATDLTELANWFNEKFKAILQD